MTVMSFGGGVQSTAILVMAAQGELDIQTFLFANVGQDSENPQTLEYVREIAIPYAIQHGLEIIELQRRLRDDSPAPTLLESIRNPRSTTIPIPVRMQNGAPGNRRCTSDYKISVINRWMRQHGATKKRPMRLALGISMDEFQRMRDSREKYRINWYPLIERRMARQDCINTIQRACLPIPPKSSCWFCPFTRLNDWREMAEKRPERFQQAILLERDINLKRERAGKDRVWLTDRAQPLDRAVGDKIQGKLFEMEPTCDTGHCFV